MDDLSTLRSIAQSGDILELEPFLKDPRCFHVDYQEQGSAFLCAAAGDRSDMLQAMINSGANVNAIDRLGGTALMTVAVNGHVQSLRLLIAYNANVNLVDQNGNTALMCAAQSGYHDVVQILIDAGADVNVINKAQKTALVLAIETGYTQIGRGATEYRESSNWRDKFGIVETLIRSGANPNIGSSKGFSCIGLAKSRGYTEIYKLLESSGASETATDAFFSAVDSGNIDEARQAIEKGADINARRSEIDTALSDAISNDMVEVVRLLIEEGCDVNTQHRVNRTPLMIATELKLPEIMRLLITAGADVNAVDDYGDTPLSLAKNDPSAATLLLDSGSKFTPIAELYFSIKNRDHELMQAAIHKGADIQSRNGAGQTPLAMAILQDDFSACKLLLNAGANPKIRLSNDKTLLMLASMAISESGDIVTLLCEAGCNPNDIDRNGATAAMYAVRYEQVGALESLIAAGADLGIKDSFGNTAESLATGWAAIRRVLRKNIKK